MTGSYFTDYCAVRLLNPL